MVTLNIDSPLSLYAIPLLYLTIMGPHLKKGALLAKILKAYPNVNPRAGIEMCRRKDVPAELIAKLERMQGAHNNGFENFPLWASSIIAANVAGVDPRTTNIVATGLIASRFVYNRLYINNDNSKVLAALRTATWGSSVIACFALLVMAANRFNARSTGAP